MQVKLPWDTSMRVALARVLNCMTQLYDELPDEARVVKAGWHESRMHFMPALSLYTRHLLVCNWRLCMIQQTLCTSWL